MITNPMKFFTIAALATAAIGAEPDGTNVAAGTVPPPAPLLPVPNQAQLRWHKAEYIMFAHFGMKTFYPSGDHMGHGTEDPKKFNPAKFDANQWVAAANAGGFKGIILTTKHHDGFCNWRTDTTDHCVKSATWKDGQGDIVRELAEACRKGGVYFGVYVSIIDNHFKAAELGKTQDYGEYYYNQLKELSTKYGPLDEYWFDGFNAANLKMDYKKIAAMIKETQPGAVIYDSGVLADFLPDRCLAWPGRHGGVGPDQTYCRKLNGVMSWYPNEPSIILQGNWFHNNQPITSLRNIQEEYLNSTGHGVTPLMNLAPNRDGLIDEDAVVRLKEFKAWVDRLHANDLCRAPGVKISADTVRGNAARYSPAMVADDDFETYHATDDTRRESVIEVNLAKVQKIDGFIVQEYIPLGQRVEGYTIECRVDGKWVEVIAGKTIGYKRIILGGRSSAAKVKFPETDGVRLKITKAHACPLISTFKVIGPME